MKQILSFIKKEVVLAIAALLAVVSMFFVPPSVKYIEYVDFSVLSILFCLMAVVAGFIKSGLFGYFSAKLLTRSNSIKIVSAVLTGLCFFSAMLITNDVALITFVPLTIAVLIGVSPKRLIFVIVLETIAANLGSVLTPIGNPQNLYIYSFYNMNIGDFLSAVAPIAALSLLLLSATLIFSKDGRIEITASAPIKFSSVDKRLLVLYTILLLLSITTVMRLLDYRICLALTAIALIIFDKAAFKRVDYSLLGTFLSFFIFVGNMGSIPIIKEILASLIDGRELIVSILASQVISNVPAAIMLSGFTDKARELLMGVNIGGLGTLIASLASLISYKLYAKSENSRPALFLGIFTIMNVAFLLIISAAAFLFLIPIGV